MAPQARRGAPQPYLNCTHNGDVPEREALTVDEHRTGTLDERVQRLESEVGEMRAELRYALRRVNRLLAEGRTEGPVAAPPAAERAANRRGPLRR